MPVIIGIYAFVPFLANGLRSLDIKYFKILFYIVFALLFVPDVINVFARVNNFDSIYSPLDFSFFGGTYGFMCIMGYAVKKEFFKNVPVAVWAILAPVSFGITVWLQYYSNSNNVEYSVWYSSALLVITSFSIFNLALRAKGLILKGFFSLVGKYSFGIYLIHNLFVIYLGYNTQTISPLKKLVFIFLISFFCSLAITFLVCKSKKLGRILFFVK